MKTEDQNLIINIKFKEKLFLLLIFKYLLYFFFNVGKMYLFIFSMGIITVCKIVKMEIEK